MSEVNTKPECGSQDLDLHTCGHSVMLDFFFLVKALAGAEVLGHGVLPAVNFILRVLKRQPVEGALYVSDIGLSASWCY